MAKYIQLVLNSLLLFSLVSFVKGAVGFTRTESDLVVNVGEDAEFKWSYNASKRSIDYTVISPIWYFHDGNTWLQIANEQRVSAAEWNWTLSNECPPGLRPRLQKSPNYNAGLLIKGVTLNDTGIYRCDLIPSSGPPISDPAWLNVTKELTTTTTSRPTTTTTATSTGSISPTTSTPGGLSAGEIVGIVFGVIIICCCCCCCIICCVKRSKKKREQKRTAEGKPEDNELNPPAATN